MKKYLNLQNAFKILSKIRKQDKKKFEYLFVQMY